MSDGLSDGYAAEMEDRRHWQYLMAMATHLVVKTQDTLEKLLDTVYSDKHKKIEDRLQKLLKKDLQEWALLLIDCKENNLSAFQRVCGISPWPASLSVRRVKFDNWSELGSFFRPFFDKEGYATDQDHGTIGGYDSYAIFYDADMSIKQIVKSSVWLGFTTTSWRTGVGNSGDPTTPWKKDRLKRPD